jgi:phage gp29-like protein
MFKHLPLKDWLIYSQRHGMPGILGRTSAGPMTDAWKRICEAVASFAQGWTGVVGKEDTIEKVDMSTTGTLPYPQLIERIDRAISALWRGADLSTMSGHGGSHGGGQGASLQGQESELLEADDCELISEVMQQQFDKWVIFYTFGTLKPLAYFEIEKPVDKDTDQDLEVDTFLLSAGFPLPIKDAAARYDRRIPQEDEELLQEPQQPLMDPPGAESGASNAQPLPNNLTRFIKKMKNSLTAANAVAWRPIIDRLEQVDRASNADFYPMLEQLQKDIPSLLKNTGSNSRNIQAWQDSIGTMLVNGLATSRN